MDVPEDGLMRMGNWEGMLFSYPRGDELRTTQSEHGVLGLVGKGSGWRGRVQVGREREKGKGKEKITESGFQVIV